MRALLDANIVTNQEGCSVANRDIGIQHRCEVQPWREGEGFSSLANWGLRPGRKCRGRLLERNELHLIRTESPEASTKARATKENSGK